MQHHHQQQQQQQQQSPQMFNTPPSQSQPTTLVSTEQIQKYLEENKQLILAIMEHQNLGKGNDTAQYQAQLQKNLMYLAAVADSQPPPPDPTGPSQPQITTQPTNPQGAMMQPSQPAISQQQSGSFGSRLPFAVQPLDQQLPHIQQQQQQSLPGGMGMRMGGNNGFHPAMQAQFGSATRLMDAHNRRDGSEGGFGDGQGKSSGQ